MLEVVFLVKELGAPNILTECGKIKSGLSLRLGVAATGLDQGKVSTELSLEGVSWADLGLNNGTVLAGLPPSVLSNPTMGKTRVGPSATSAQGSVSAGSDIMASTSISGSRTNLTK